ncbi:hypothetical protein [Nocardioides xinjiangensis]|uniref:hypothetical protein n=1 Tax=Nocardioides xinjiangensis TaxID=2817376 RepID=UPI001B303402|nr:hypothetical protein [Nocardioides sp. SYSU D00778]
MGFVEFVVFVLPQWAVGALNLYWIIRLGVRHGTLDACRIDRVDERIARIQADTGRSGDLQ